MKKIKCEICSEQATMWLDNDNEVGEGFDTCYGDRWDGPAGKA